MTVGERLKSLRIKKGLTQEELGDLLGVKKAAVHKYEAGIVINLKRETLKKLADILGIGINELIRYEECVAEKDLVQVENNQVVVSSRQVANNFGKHHKDVLENIRDILAAENSATRFFSVSTFENRGKQYPEYLISRDGFSLLAMGFTGKKALEWKLKYIQAFNKMEQKLNEVPVTNLGSLVKLMREIRERMNDQGCSAYEIAVTQKSLCEQYGISLPECFIKPEKTTLQDAFNMIEYIFNQPRGRGHKGVSYDGFIVEHSIQVNQIKEK